MNSARRLSNTFTTTTGNFSLTRNQPNRSMSSSTQPDATPASYTIDVANLKPSDTLIAVMGMTGAGKSTFISHCTDVPVPRGHSMTSCTQEVVVYPYREVGSGRTFLVDTPGFDDTNRTDTQVLKEIATWLTDTFNEKVQLSGLIYLHRISDNRVTGSAKRNLFMFKKLCGPAVFKKVRLATTMWETNTEVGEAREKELVDTEDFWGYMIRQGATTYRHYNNRASALKLVDEFLKPEDAGGKIVLKLQQEMQTGATLEETGAGQEVDYQLRELKRQYQKEIEEFKAQQQEALLEHDKESAKGLEELRFDYARKIEALDRGREQLRADMEMLHKGREQALIVRLKEQEDAMEKLKTQMVTATQEDRRLLMKEIEAERVKNNLLSQQVKSISERVTRRATMHTMNLTSINRMKDGCSLSVYNNEVVFAGASHFRTNYGPLEVRTHNTVDETMYFVFGEQESWYRHYHHMNECKDETSENFQKLYPGLHKLLSARKKSICPKSVSLGLKGAYYFQDRKRFGYQFSTAQKKFLIEKLGEKRFPSYMRRVWLGLNDILVCLDITNKLHCYKLGRSDHKYPGLEAALMEHDTQHRKIKTIAMSLTDDTCWFAAWKYTHAHHLGRSDIIARHFVQWCRMNQGTRSNPKEEADDSD